jgi:iron complex outermembrane receptor protein
MSGDFDVMTPEQFVAAGGDDKGSRSYNWKDAVLQNGFSTNHDFFTKSTENLNTRRCASSTDGIVKIRV